jgi:hypothetical protein
MNRNDFINMIDDSVQVNRQMLGEVYELIDIFPYFQCAHMLLLKGLQDNSDVKFESQLRNSAIHIADREVLYYFLKAKPSQKVDPNEIKTEKPVSGNYLYDTQQTVIESAKNSEQLINEIEKNSGNDNPEEQHNKATQVLNQTILVSSESNNEESAGVLYLMDEDISSSEEKVFFMDPGFSAPEQEDLLELETEVFETRFPDKEDVEKEQIYKEEKNFKKHLQSELIDKFIIANPRIEPNKEKSNLPDADISKPFVEEEGGFITETLAKIYTNQGYYSKAIDIYEKLSLKFPEKSSYFASQIEKVKEYIKK